MTYRAVRKYIEFPYSQQPSNTDHVLIQKHIIFGWWITITVVNTWDYDKNLEQALLAIEERYKKD